MTREGKSQTQFNPSEFQYTPDAIDYAAARNYTTVRQALNGIRKDLGLSGIQLEQFLSHLQLHCGDEDAPELPDIVDVLHGQKKLSRRVAEHIEDLLEPREPFLTKLYP